MVQVTADNIDQWRDVASASFVPLAVQRATADFSASMEQRQLSENVSLASIRTQAIVIDRNERLTSRSVNDDVHISLQVGAAGWVEQDGRSSRVGPGVLTVCDTQRPFRLNYVEPNQRHIVLQTSRSSLGVSEDILRHAAGRQVAGANPARDAYISLVTSLMSQSELTPAASMEMSGILTSLAGAMLTSAFENKAVLPTTHEALGIAMVDFIRAHLGSPDLSPETLALAHFTSRRTVYEIFAEVGESPAEVIRRMRVTEAATRLRDAGSVASVTEIAFDCGFADVTTFARVFRRYFECTPREYRGASAQ